MARKKPGTGSIKRFGARYGRGVKLRFGKIEAEQRKYHTCPYCRAVRVKRVALGIWQCRKCDAKFAGRAYTVGTKASRATKGLPKEEEVEEAQAEDAGETKEPEESPAEKAPTETEGA